MSEHLSTRQKAQKKLGVSICGVLNSQNLFGIAVICIVVWTGIFQAEKQTLDVNGQSRSLLDCCSGGPKSKLGNGGGSPKWLDTPDPGMLNACQNHADCTECNKWLAEQKTSNGAFPTADQMNDNANCKACAELVWNQC